MAQWVKAPATEPEDLTLIWNPYGKRRKLNLTYYLLTFIFYTHTHTEAHTKK